MKGYQGIRTIKTSEYENTRSDFKCHDYREKWKAICQTTLSKSLTQRAFSDKVAPVIDDFTDEPEFQCDVQVVKDTFVHDFE